MAEITLKAELREELGRKVKNLRKENKIPAVCYGKEFKNLNLTFDKQEFGKVLAEAGTSTLVDLVVSSGESFKVLIHEPQINPVTEEIVHVDLYKVNMKEEIHTEIPLEFIGVSKAVEELEGNLIEGKDALEVKCLPDKLVSEIKVDISKLNTFDDLIKVGDLDIPEGIEILADADEIIAQVTAPRSEEELEEMETEAAADTEKAQIENIEEAAAKEQAEKEATAEGEAEGGETSKEEKEPEKKNE
jgi:large subunit ribosomal protein L25